MRLKSHKQPIGSRSHCIAYTCITYMDHSLDLPLMRPSESHLFPTEWFLQDLEMEGARYERVCQSLRDIASTPYTHVFVYLSKSFQEVYVYDNADAHYFKYRDIFLNAANTKSKQLCYIISKLTSIVCVRAVTAADIEISKLTLFAYMRSLQT